MMPVLFRIPLLNWEVPGYGLMLMVGFLLTVAWAARRAARSGANPDVVLNCAFIALLGGVAGARFMYVVHYWEQFAYRGNPLDIAIAVIDVRQGGLEVYGGVLAAIGGALIYLALYRHSIRWYMDIMAPSTALGMGIGRIGCFLNGCCWGVPCDLPWAVRFPYGSNAAIQQWYDGVPGADLPKELIVFPPDGIGPTGQAAYPIARDLLRVTPEQLAKGQRWNELTDELGRAGNAAERQRIERERLKLGGCHMGTVATRATISAALDRSGLTLAELQALARAHPSQPVHPTQLYSAIVLVLLALLLNSVYWRRARDGQVICTLLLIEPVSRYALEVVRADNPVDTLGAFTISQFIAIVMTLAGLVGLLALRHAAPRSPYARLWEPPEEEKPSRPRKKGTAGARK